MYNFEIKLIDETILRGTMDKKEYKKLKRNFSNNSISFEFNYIGGKKEIVLVLKTNIVYIKVKERNEAK